MGRSSSSSASTTTNNNTTNTLQGLYGANVAGDDVYNNQDYNQDYSNTNISYEIDGGAFDFASDASAQLSDTAQAAIRANTDTLGDAYALSEHAIDSIAESGAQFSDALADQNQRAIEFAGDTVTDSLNSSSNLMDKVLDFASNAGSIVDNAMSRTAQQSGAALNFATNASKADGGQTENIIKFVMVGLAVVGVAFAFGGKKR
jgi:hypothetical protein